MLLNYVKSLVTSENSCLNLVHIHGNKKHLSYINIQAIYTWFYKQYDQC